MTNNLQQSNNLSRENSTIMKNLDFWIMMPHMLNNLQLQN